MKRIFTSLSIIILAFTILSCCNECNDSWNPIFNGKNLDNWDMHIGTPLTGFEEQAKNATTNKVFSIVKENGENLIRISGEVNGSLATKESFENYHLQLVFKWGDEVFTKRNSGLLYHSFGEFGAAIGTWMTNIECQLMHEKLGDTYLMNNTNCETEVEETDDVFIFSAGSEKISFGEKSNGRKINKAKDLEKPLGEWNTVDLYCLGTTAVHVVNGETVMVNTNCGIYTEEGIKPLNSGKIQIQSEGGELFIKSIKAKPIEELPESILK